MNAGKRDGVRDCSRQGRYASTWPGRERREEGERLAARVIRYGASTWPGRERREEDDGRSRRGQRLRASTWPGRERREEAHPLGRAYKHDNGGDLRAAPYPDPNRRATRVGNHPQAAGNQPGTIAASASYVEPHHWTARTDFQRTSQRILTTRSASSRGCPKVCIRSSAGTLASPSGTTRI